MINQKALVLFGILIFSLTLVSPISWSGGGGTFVDTNATTGCTGSQVLFGNGSCGVIVAGTGDITSVQGDIYITNGSNSGAVNLIFNETQLNNTIDDRIPATTNPFDQDLNTTSNTNFANVTTTGFFTGLFNWIINLADSSPAYLTFNGSTLSFNETKLNETITDLDTDTNDSLALASVNTTVNSQVLLNGTGIYSTFNATYDAFNNETNRIQNLTTYDCGSDEYVVGVHNNGTVDCLTVTFNYNQTGLNGSLWSQSGSNIFYNGGNVGINISSPGNTLTIVPTTSTDGIVVRESDNGNDAINIIATPSKGIFTISRSGAVAITLDSLGVTVFNEQGDAGNDFRIEGDTNVNLFYVDASTDSIGIGTASPDTLLSIEDTDPLFTLKSSDTTLVGDQALGEVQFRGDDSSTGRGNQVYSKILGLAEDNSGAGGTINGGIGEGGIISFTTGIDNTGSTNLVLAERMRIDASGNVGIGTTTPGRILTVSDTTNDGTNGLFLTSFSPNIVFEDRSTNSDDYQIRVDGDRFQIFHDDDGTTFADIFLTILGASGNIGIGTTVPTSQLSIGGTGFTKLELRRDIASDGAGFFINFAFDDSNGDIVNYSRIRAGSDDVTAGTEDGSLAFFNMVAGTLTEAVRFVGTNVGIGTETPIAKLQVGSGTAATTIMTSASNDGIFVDTGVLRAMFVGEGSGESHFIAIDAGATANQRAISFASDGMAGFIRSYNDGFGLRQNFIVFNMTSTTGDLLFNRDGGNVGIGTSSPSHIFNVVGDSKFDDTLGVGINPQSGFDLATGQKILVGGTAGLEIQATRMQRKVNDSFFAISGSTAFNRGPNILMNGEDRSFGAGRLDIGTPATDKTSNVLRFRVTGNVDHSEIQVHDAHLIVNDGNVSVVSGSHEVLGSFDAAGTWSVEVIS